jgi:malate dehydrogenase (oxaloacetate-decarboxylating)(NADP+)
MLVPSNACTLHVLQAAVAAGGPSARPLVLALSNPNSKAECSFEDALQWSGGRAVFASGSPWPALTVRPQAAGVSAASAFTSLDSSSSSSSDRISRKSSSGMVFVSSSPGSSSSSSSSGVLLRPAQANNCLVFPGLGLGAVQSGAAAVTDEMLLAAAKAVAGA